MLAQLGEWRCRTPEEFKAWSQNLGHEQVMTTFSVYGAVALTRQNEIIRELSNRGHGCENDRAAEITAVLQRRAFAD